MITAVTSDKITRKQTTLALGVAATACIGLVACSSSGAPAAKPPAVHTAQVPSSSGSSAPPTSSAPASSTHAGSSSAAGGTGTSNPCALLTRSDVAAAIAEPVDAGTVQGVAGSGACVYASTSGSIAGGLIVVSSWQKFTDAFRTQKIKLSPVSGIGDQAASVYGGGGYPALIVRKGTVGFEVSIHGPHVLALADHGLAKEEDLARVMLSRL